MKTRKDNILFEDNSESYCIKNGCREIYKEELKLFKEALMLQKRRVDVLVNLVAEKEKEIKKIKEIKRILIKWSEG